MKKYIVLSPEGVTIAPNNETFDNFQVLGFVTAENKEAAVKEWEKEYPFLQKAKYETLWIHELVANESAIIHLEEDETVRKLSVLVQENGFSDIEFDFQDENYFYFDAYSDAKVQVRCHIDGNEVYVYERYLTDKNFFEVGVFEYEIPGGNQDESNV